jgi:hypothetical protein
MGHIGREKEKTVILEPVDEPAVHEEIPDGTAPVPGTEPVPA